MSNFWGSHHFTLVLLHNGFNVNEIVRIFNDIRWECEHFSPYVMFGDPYQNKPVSNICYTNPSDCGNFKSGNQSVLLISVKNMSEKILSVEMKGKSNEVWGMRGNNFLTLVNVPPYMHGKIIDYSQEWNHEIDWLKKLFKRINWLNSVYQAIKIYQGEELCENKISQAWNKLQDVNEKLSITIYEMLQTLEMFHRERFYQTYKYVVNKSTIN